MSLKCMTRTLISKIPKATWTTVIQTLVCTNHKYDSSGPEARSLRRTGWIINCVV